MHRMRSVGREVTHTHSLTRALTLARAALSVHSGGALGSHLAPLFAIVLVVTHQPVDENQAHVIEVLLFLGSTFPG